MLQPSRFLPLLTLLACACTGDSAMNISSRPATAGERLAEAEELARETLPGARLVEIEGYSAREPLGDGRCAEWSYRCLDPETGRSLTVQLLRSGRLAAGEAEDAAGPFPDWDGGFSLDSDYAARLVGLAEEEAGGGFPPLCQSLRLTVLADEQGTRPVWEITYYRHTPAGFRRFWYQLDADSGERLAERVEDRTPPLPD